MTIARPAEQRLMDKVVPVGDCWLWTGCLDRGGYGRFYFNGTGKLAHRAAFEILVGPIPEGLTIDHLCRERRCVNPAHLEPVTQRVNIRRGAHNGSQGKTHCPHGHPYEGDNVRWGRTPNGTPTPICRTCERAAGARYRAKVKLGDMSAPVPSDRKEARTDEIRAVLRSFSEEVEGRPAWRVSTELEYIADVSHLLAVVERYENALGEIAALRDEAIPLRTGRGRHIFWRAVRLADAALAGTEESQ